MTLFKKKNARISSSVILVFIWKDINVIKKNYIYFFLDDMNVIFYYIYVISNEHQNDTRRSFNILHLIIIGCECLIMKCYYFSYRHSLFNN
jgi:hypothetical protein